ncbi:hypothetical protein [Cohnella soli]|uniref:Uncharacterized protein n=1 Tax=Cohnella soli TaxID=425005 RepID=A0ABW0HPE6_9BACL
MRIDLSAFKENLPEQREYLQGLTPGLFRAIDAAHHVAKSDAVDWSGFTLEEAKRALEMAMYYESDENIDEIDLENGVPNEGNAIHEFLHNVQVISKFKHIQPEKAGEEIIFF